MLRIIVSLSVLILSVEAFASFLPTREGKLYVGGRVGTSHVGEADHVVWGADATFGLNRSVEAGLSVLGQDHIGSGTNPLVVTTATIEVHPLKDLNDLTASVGIGPGLYYYGSDSNPLTRVGFNFGGNLDILLSDFHIGLSSRYHVVGDNQYGGNFWNIMIRMGYDFFGT